MRWSDKDVYGHVNNARFLTLFEEARVAAFFPTFERGIVISLFLLRPPPPPGEGWGEGPISGA